MAMPPALLSRGRGVALRRKRGHRGQGVAEGAAWHWARQSRGFDTLRNGLRGTHQAATEHGQATHGQVTEKPRCAGPRARHGKAPAVGFGRDVGTKEVRSAPRAAPRPAPLVRHAGAASRGARAAALAAGPRGRAEKPGPQTTKRAQQRSTRAHDSTCDASTTAAAARPSARRRPLSSWYRCSEFEKRASRLTRAIASLRSRLRSD